MEGAGVRQNNGGNRVHNFFVDSPQVGTDLANQPLLARLAGISVAINALLLGFDLKSLARFNHGGLDGFDDQLLNARAIGARAAKKPLVASLASNLSIFEVSNATKLQCLIRSNDLKGADSGLFLLSRVEREWLTSVVVIKAIFIVSVPQTEVPMSVNKRAARLIANDWVSDNAKIPGRDHQHGLDIGDGLLVLLERIHTRSNDNSSASLIIIQHVDIIEGQNPQNGAGHDERTSQKTGQEQRKEERQANERERERTREKHSTRPR
jgi:hypothetical protein